jgi:hypothetical protein
VVDAADDPASQGDEMMNLTADKLNELLIYEPDTGVFRWRVTLGHRGKAGRMAGAIRNGYRLIGIDKKMYAAHRLAWVMVHGDWPDGEIDHINGDPSDNRITNLRDVGRGINLQNQRSAQARSKSGLLGASFHKARGKWRAQIAFQGKTEYLGYFDSAEEAHTAYVRRKRELHVGCTI